MFCGNLEFAAQAFLGVTMSNHVRHQLSCRYLEEMDFGALNCISTKLAMEGRIQAHFFDNRVSMWGYLDFNTYTQPKYNNVHNVVAL